jgi:hypothetical protein
MTHNLRHKEHIDKKEKLEAGSVTTKTSTNAHHARKRHATEDSPGVIEEGKIFFFYRPAPPSVFPVNQVICPSIYGQICDVPTQGSLIHAPVTFRAAGGSQQQWCPCPS